MAKNELKPMIIYNLFPLLAGRLTEWGPHLKRASDMHFNWVFVNPIQKPGCSGSLYSIADYFDFNPVLVDPACGRTAEEQVKEMISTAEALGLKVMADLVINHCAADSGLIAKHPEWFCMEDGRIVHPGADADGRRVVWADLAKFDHRNTKDQQGLVKYFLDIIEHMISLGFKGFRCDAAYQVPRRIWERIISETKKKHGEILFFAETLGSPSPVTRKTAEAGFDYIFNSSKWWNYYDYWLMEQYSLTRDLGPSIAFPESHDTARLAEELNGSVEGLKQRYLFAALFSGGVMMPIGFEFGFRKRLHVVNTKPGDWEQTSTDLTDFIRTVNTIKATNAVFQEDGPTHVLHHANNDILLMWKVSLAARAEALFILNKDINHPQDFYSENLRNYTQAGNPLTDVSPSEHLDYIPAPFHFRLLPGQGLVLTTSEDEPPEE
ncbi:MAG TPA: alpha-amylase family glycosyl hydrolase [Nitrospirota bacterium]|nr:alpha-amylase family glycosyl hydrolase [Nitrospirota bacterium]